MSKTYRLYFDLDNVKPKSLYIKDLALHIGVNKQSILRMKRTEDKTRRYPKKILEQLCTYFHCHVADLLRFEGDDRKKKITVPSLEKNEKFVIQTNLILLLDKEGISVQRFAALLERPYETVRKFAHDKMERLPQDLIEEVCEFFNIGLEELFTMNIAKKTSDDEVSYLKNKRTIKRHYEVYTTLSEHLGDIDMESLSRETGVSYSFIFKTANNSLQTINIKNLEKVCDYLDVSPHDVIKYRVKKGKAD